MGEALAVWEPGCPAGMHAHWALFLLQPLLWLLLYLFAAIATEWSAACEAAAESTSIVVAVAETAAASCVTVAAAGAWPLALR